MTDRVQGAHRIEAAKSGRASCTTCNKPIEHGDARVAEQVNDISIGRLIYRYYHLECAIAVHPDLVHSALGNVDPQLALDVATVETKIEPRLALDREQRLARYEAIKASERKRDEPVAPDDTTLELIAQLQDNPDDSAALAVLADQLQARGDPRGELIAMQLAMAAGRTSELAHRRAELMHALAPPLDPGDRLVWGTGFVRRLELADKTGARLADTISLWQHPSLRVLSELAISFAGSQDTTFVPRLVPVAPRSLRVLELTARHGALPAIPELLAALPHLDAAALVGKLPYDNVAHARLRKLELGVADSFAAVAALRPKSLPSVVELAFPALWRVTDFDELADVLATHGWLDRITHLALLRGGLSNAGILALERGLGGKKLARLDLGGTPMRLALRARLADLCDTLVMPSIADEPTAELWVEHANKPEWGRGRIVERRGDKVTIEFPDAGKKIFKADAPFLRYG